MQQATFFLLIHLIAFFALAVHVGFDRDGFDNQNKTLTLRGKIATFGLLPTALLFFIVFIVQNGFAIHFSIVYVAFGITIMAFIIPFLTTCHDSHSPKKIKLNFVGYITIIIGWSGLIGSIIWALDNSSDAVENYMEVLGQFIAGTSAFIALSGTTIETDTDGRNHLTDLGHVAALTILIGFLVATTNGLLDSKQDDELAQTAEDTKRTLLAADTVINLKLKPNVESVSEQMEYIRKNIVPTLNGILNQLQDLQKISRKIDELNNSSAKAQKLEEINLGIGESKANIEKLENSLSAFQSKNESQNAQFNQRLDQQNLKLDNNATRLAEANSKLNLLNQQNEQITQIANQLNNLTKSLQNIQAQTSRISEVEKELANLKAKTKQLDDLKKSMEILEKKIEQNHHLDTLKKE